MLWLANAFVLLSLLRPPSDGCISASWGYQPPLERPGSAAAQLTSAITTLQRSCWLRWRRRWRQASSWACPPPARRRCGSRATTPRCAARTLQVPPARHDCTALKTGVLKVGNGVHLMCQARHLKTLAPMGDLGLRLEPGSHVAGLQTMAFAE